MRTAFDVSKPSNMGVGMLKAAVKGPPDQPDQTSTRTKSLFQLRTRVQRLGSTSFDWRRKNGRRRGRRTHPVRFQPKHTWLEKKNLHNKRASDRLVGRARNGLRRRRPTLSDRLESWITDPVQVQNEALKNKRKRCFWECKVTLQLDFYRASCATYSFLRSLVRYMFRVINNFFLSRNYSVFFERQRHY